MKQIKKIPLYAKIGWVGCWLLILVLVSMIIKNCAGSIFYGSSTSKQELESYYNQGYSDAVIGNSADLNINSKNPLFKKTYTKGYREGLDARTGKTKKDTP